MKIKFEAKFAKDLRIIKDGKFLIRLKEVVEECKHANHIREIKNIKKLQGYDSFYRIRIGDYRVGIEIIDDEIIFTRCLHRKNVYKYFP